MQLACPYTQFAQKPPTQTPCMVGLGSKERSLGQAAIAKINSNIKNSAFELKRLIGRRWNESDLQVLTFEFAVLLASDEMLDIYSNIAGVQCFYIHGWVDCLKYCIILSVKSLCFFLFTLDVAVSGGFEDVPLQGHKV